MPELKRILFVDDEPNVLQGLRRSLRGQRHLWDMHFTESPRAALEQIQAEDPFDVVVSDMQMPEMNGADFLAEVMRLQPSTVRFVLSGHTSSERLVQSSTVAHQFLSKPCDPSRLGVLINRACTLRADLSTAALNRKLLEIGGVPSMPATYHQILREMQSGEPDVGKVGRLIEQDVGLSAKILQIVNSAFMGLKHHVSDIVHATSLLGLDNLRRLVLMAEIFNPDQEKALAGSLNLTALWERSIRVADFARRIAEEETDEKQVLADTFTAALLHEVGLVVLAIKLPDEFKLALAVAQGNKIPLLEAEKQAFGSTHAAIGGYLLELWGLPEPVVEAITYHDFPSAAPEEVYIEGETPPFSPLTALHVASYFSTNPANTDPTLQGVDLDTYYMERIGMIDKVEGWLDRCLAM